MSLYGPLAGEYDELTGDVPYEQLADWYESAFTLKSGAVHTVLDLCCGTGTLSLILTHRGYEMICADASADMLSVFQQKLWELPDGLIQPMLLAQRAEELDLNDTVDACVCCLDGVNYMEKDILPEVFHRLKLFISPGGVLAFDFLSPEHLRSLDGQCFVDERDDFLCLWRASLDDDALHYGMDIFSLVEDDLWEREQEEHIEYIHSPESLKTLLQNAGFINITIHNDGPQNENGRLFVTAIRKED